MANCRATRGKIGEEMEYYVDNMLKTCCKTGTFVTRKLKMCKKFPKYLVE